MSDTLVRGSWKISEEATLKRVMQAHLDLGLRVGKAAGMAAKELHRTAHSCYAKWHELTTESPRQRKPKDYQVVKSPAIHVVKPVTSKDQLKVTAEVGNDGLSLSVEGRKYTIDHRDNKVVVTIQLQ